MEYAALISFIVLVVTWMALPATTSLDMESAPSVQPQAAAA
jgi:hypothetical protein